jgi:ribosomal protein L29
MKKTDKITLREKSAQELQKTLADTQKQLVESKAKFALGNLKDSSLIGKLKYQIALIKTLIGNAK